MNYTFLDLLNNHIKNPNRVLFYQKKLIHFLKSNNLNIYDNFKLDQSGGAIYKTKIDNIEFSIEYHISESSDNNLIYITNTNQNIKNSYCAMLYYNDNETLYIGIIENPINCIKHNDNNIKIKYGDLMMKIIIKFAMDKNFKFW